jgi:hypothetical protein
MGGACSTHGDMNNEYKILVRCPEGKRTFRRAMRVCEDNIKVDFKEIMLGM